MGMFTSFFCFFVNGVPDFVSSAGGIGGAGADIEAVALSVRSTSGSLNDDGPSKRVAPRVM